MTDSQIAKLLSIVDGKGNFLCCVPLNPGKFVSELLAKLSKFGTSEFTYPLQSWKGSYVIYEKKSVEVSNIEELLRCALRIFVGIRRYRDAIGKSIKTIYLCGDFTDTCGCVMSVDDAVWRLLFVSAREFVKKNRASEITLFNKIYIGEKPRDCFINLYESGSTSSLSRHRDHVSFCTIVLCLLNDASEGGNLVLFDERGKEQVIPLRSEEMIVFARIEHYVQSSTRKSNRVTMNAFF